MPYVVRKIPFENVQDTSGLEAAIAAGDFAADDIVALIGKVEGNGGVNDFSRVLADRVLRDFLVEHAAKTRAEALQVPIAWSGGCDGVISPHMTVFAKVDGPAEPADEKRLAVGFAVSEPIFPEEIGRLPMVDKVAVGVREAMAAAGISDSSDVHFVQTKTPLLTAERIADAHSRGETVALTDTMESMAVSNATSALGIATALGEIPRPQPEQIAKDLSVYSSVASCSSGVEQVEAQIVVVGNRTGVGGRYRIGHSVMRDALDFDGIYDAIRSAGLELPEHPRAEDLGGRVVNCFIKCEADPSGGCGDGGRWRSTTPTCTTRTTPRARWAAWRPPPSATRPCSSRWPGCSRARRAAARWPPSWTSGREPARGAHPEELTDEQRELYESIAGGDRARDASFRLTEADGSLVGPFNVLLLSPVVGNAVQSVGRHSLRLRSEPHGAGDRHPGGGRPLALPLRMVGPRPHRPPIAGLSDDPDQQPCTPARHPSFDDETADAAYAFVQALIAGGRAPTTRCSAPPAMRSVRTASWNWSPSWATTASWHNSCKRSTSASPPARHPPSERQVVAPWTSHRSKSPSATRSSTT